MSYFDRASAACPAGSTCTTEGYVNIKSPTFGATGNGSTDDTAAIQAAIDYAYNNNIQGIFCPDGNYKTSSTIYLDANGVGSLRNNFANPSLSNFSMHFFGGDLGVGNVTGFGCRLNPTFSNGIAFIVGPGQEMKVSGIMIYGPSAAYRGNQNPASVGLGIASGNAGATDTLIENVTVTTFYNAFKTNANGQDSLSDVNTFRHVYAYGAQNCIYISGTQAYIDSIYDSVLSNCTNAVYTDTAKRITAVGGNYSANIGVASSFTIGTVSAFTKTADNNGFDYTFTAVVTSPDVYIPNVYNSYTIATPDFGVIPLTMTAWNSGTNTGTFKLWPGWVFGNYGDTDLTTTTDIQAEVAAVTTLYAAERITTANGNGIHLIDTHIENPNACQTLANAFATAGAASYQMTIDNVFFDSDPGLIYFKPVNGPTAANLARYYCQQSFPFISASRSGGQNTFITVNGGDFGMNNASGNSPLLLIERDTNEGNPYSTMRFNQVVSFSNPNERGNFYGHGITQGYRSLDSSGHGLGIWTESPFFPLTTTFTYHDVANYNRWAETSGPYCGWRPCPWTTPNLAPGIYSTVSGSLGILGSYAPINCETTYRSVEWNSGALAHQFLRSASCPGWSWGQALNDASVGGTVKWSYKGQSNVLYLDAGTLGWMFAGLGITINNGSGAHAYIVTGVYPDITTGSFPGYVTVIDGAGDSGGALVGTKTTIYSCSSSCTVGQAAYSWTAY